MKFFLGSIFFILDAIAESNIIFRGLMVSRIQKWLFICLHHSQFPRYALQCNGKGTFCYGQRYIFMGSSQEKRTVTALARRGKIPPTCTAPAGWKTPCWQSPGCISPIHQPPAAGEALHLAYVSFSDTHLLSVVWFGWQQPQLLRNFMISQFNRSLLDTGNTTNQRVIPESQEWEVY